MQSLRALMHMAIWFQETFGKEIALDFLAEEKDQVTELKGRLAWEWLDGSGDQMVGRVFIWRGEVCWLYVWHDGW